MASKLRMVFTLSNDWEEQVEIRLHWILSFNMLQRNTPWDHGSSLNPLRDKTPLAPIAQAIMQRVFIGLCL